MNIRQVIEQAIENYRKTKGKRLFSSIKFFEKFDIGLNRADSLNSIVNKMDEDKLSDKQFLCKFSLIYADKREYPNGLGNSTELREHLSFALCDLLEIKENTITEEEIKSTTHQYTYHIDADGCSGSFFPSRDFVIKKIMGEKANAALLKMAEQEKNRIACCESFLAGFHRRLGMDSALKTFSNDSIFDKNTVELIFSFASMNNKLQRAA